VRGQENKRSASRIKRIAKNKDFPLILYVYGHCMAILPDAIKGGVPAHEMILTECIIYPLLGWRSAKHVLFFATGTSGPEQN
jgi:hypothetical protein